MYSFIILYNSFDIPMSRYLFSETQNVAFAPLTSLSKLCFSVPAMIIGVYFPTFIQSHHLRKNGYKELFHALGLTLALAAGIILVLNFDKELLVGLVFGKRYSGAEETLIYTCLSMTCLSLVNVLAHYYIAFEKFSVLAILFIFLAGQGVAAVAFPDIQMLQYVQNELYIFIGLLIALVIGLKFSSQQGLKVNVEIAPN
jgi:O-antigen/teichoic acid export membrane protein